MAVKTAEEDSQKAMARYNEVRQSLDKISGEITSLCQQCEAQEKEHRDLRTKLDIEISRFNTGQDYTLQYFELDKYFSDPQSWQQLRKTIDDHKKRVAAEQFKVESASQEVARLEASPSRPAEEEEHSVAGMRTAREMLIKKVEEIEKERNSLEFVVKTHKDSIQNMEFYRPTLEKAEANWQAWKQLCDVLGSADGNAFREIAQCYTFDFLVDFANLQLADLTSRYYLRKRRNTLQLEVVDRYMLDQVRAVNSLSGGETFIVSLALALGLSALSGNNLEIGSLFIDEGFGNLDNENLNMVIDALSNLPRTQHRKVGVISHTELIQSRISPKICLIPETGGRSRIEVKG
jgi:exonuclease SbcC